jgi:chromate reductase
MTAPEAYIHYTKEAFPGGGVVANESTSAFLTNFMEEFRDHVIRVLTVLLRKPHH